MSNSFINPYNFIPLAENAPVRGSVPAGVNTGVIRFSLQTRTPLIIPNTSNEDAFKVKDDNGKKIDDHKSYDFFSYDDLSVKNNLGTDGTREGLYSEPVIRGSEIRGMLRSYYEILTNSCLSFVDDTEVLSKRTLEVFKPGLIERDPSGRYYLYAAADCRLKDKSIAATLTDCQEVYFDVIYTGRVSDADNVSTTAHRTHTGYVIKGEAGPRKKHSHIFFNSKTSSKRPLNEDEIETLDLVLDSYNGVSKRLSKRKATTKYRDYDIAWKDFKRGSGPAYFPVRYSEAIGGFTMLSPASITREIYQAKLRDIIGEHSSCNQQSALCPACALFGTVAKRFQVSSRIRVADMRLDDKNASGFEEDNTSIYEDIVTLEPLNSPKINNMEFYLKKPADDAWFWTYDYYVDNKGVAHKNTPTINGRKFYWHQPDMTINKQKPDNLNVTVRPLKKGVVFTGEIFFNHLSDIELNELIYTINAGDDAELNSKSHCYKLGHAKPLGYGSVALHVDSVKLRKISICDDSESISYSMDPYSPEEPELDSEIVKNFNEMTDFNKLKGKEIHYPRPDVPDNDGNFPIFKWFVKNHGGYDHRNMRTIGMPRSRLQMTYLEHMYALEPELKKTGAPEHMAPNNGANYNRPRNRKSPELVVEVRVNKVRDDGTILFIVNGKKGRVFGDRLNGKHFKEGDKVKVILFKEKEHYSIYNLAD